MALLPLDEIRAIAEILDKDVCTDDLAQRLMVAHRAIVEERLPPGSAVDFSTASASFKQLEKRERQLAAAVVLLVASMRWLQDEEEHLKRTAHPAATRAAQKLLADFREFIYAGDLVVAPR